jgi:hypothetical protein
MQRVQKRLETGAAVFHERDRTRERGPIAFLEFLEQRQQLVG